MSNRDSAGKTERASWEEEEEGWIAEQEWWDNAPRNSTETASGLPEDQDKELNVGLAS